MTRSDTTAVGLPLRLGEGWGERLSCLSSCIGESGTRIACFCIEANEQFAGERDADDHFFLSGGAQAVAEVTEAVIIARGNVSDEEQDRAHGAASAADRALALSLTTVVSDWGDADELGNGLVGVGADLGQVSHQPGHGTASYAHNGSSSIMEAISPSSWRDCRLSRAITSSRLASISALSNRPARRCFWTIRSSVTWRSLATRALRRSWAAVGAGVGCKFLARAKRAMMLASIRSVFSRMPIASA